MPQKLIELDAYARKAAIEAIRRYFAAQREEEISEFTGSLILDFMLSEIGPYIYNAAIGDAHSYFTEKVDDLLGLEKRAR